MTRKVGALLLLAGAILLLITGCFDGSSVKETTITYNSRTETITVRVPDEYEGYPVDGIRVQIGAKDYGRVNGTECSFESPDLAAGKTLYLTVQIYVTEGDSGFQYFRVSFTGGVLTCVDITPKGT
jgi:hypothetical protein